MRALVGYTGFVGSNICSKGEFDRLFNSKNIEDAYGLQPELLIYSGVSAEKFLANKEPEKDFENILKAEENIERIKPKRLVLISTIDVIPNPIDVYEDVKIDSGVLQPYGKNRYELEKWARNNYESALIVRLPGLFGNNIKKNFIYDYINIIPSLLTDKKMNELALKCSELKDYYRQGDNGFYKLNALVPHEKDHVKRLFKQLGFSAINFADSRSVFQFYNLDRLYCDIMLCLNAGIKLCHLATEPILTSELYSYLSGESFNNELDKEPLFYDYKTKYAKLFGRQDNYIESKTEVMKQIKKFVERVGRNENV